MSHYRTDCVDSRVKNTSGQDQYFHFLPPHGRFIPNGGEIAVSGNVFDAVGNAVAGSKRELRILALKQALESGMIQILNTGASVVQDDHGQPKMLDYNNGSVIGRSPCWETTGSESASAVP